MKYRTVLELVTEANNEGDAVDVVGDFLKGDIESGVKMKCSTRPVRPHWLLGVGTACFVLLMVAGGLTFLTGHKNVHAAFTRREHVYAIQPALKTNKSKQFEEAWHKERNEKVFAYIKK